MMNDDMELVQEYAVYRSEQAFEALVSRHVALVHSAALRQVGNPHLAEEITQTVFIILARKAASLSQKTILAGWLYRTTRYVSAAALKIQHRRERREQEAHMQATVEQTQTDSAWEQLAPMLDVAMAQLRDTDRDAIVLRYFQNKSLRDVGAMLGVDESVAQKRVGRAVEKLRSVFAKRGFISTTAIIAGAISANSAQAAPVALAKSVTAIAIAKSAVASGSTLTLIKEALTLMAWTKTKAAVVAGAVLMLAAGTTTVILKEYSRQSQAQKQWTPAEKQMFEGSTARLINGAKISAVASFHFADTHQGQWPTNFAQLKLQYPECLLSDSDWEFVSGGNRSNFSNLSQTILFKERESRRSPDGGFVRVYAFADYSIQVLSSPNDDFAALEKQLGYLLRPATN